jgi:DME family drug/metabolite transporter
MTVAREPTHVTISMSNIGLAAVVLAAATWSLGTVGASELLSRGVTPPELAQSRVVLTALGLALAGLATPSRRPAGSAQRVRASASEPAGGEQRVRAPRWHLLGFATALGLVMVLILLAIGRLGVAVGTVLHYIAPLLVVVWGAVAGRRRPSVAVLGSAVASLLGVAMVSGALSGGMAGIDPLGVAFGLASAGCFAIYTVLGESVMAAYGPTHALLRGFGLAAAGWLLYQVARGWPAPLFEAGNVGLVVFVGVIGTLLPFLLFLWGVRRVRAQRAAIAATLEPVISAVIAWVVLGQALTPLQIAGAAVILTAVAALQVLAAGQGADVRQRTSP